MRIEQEVKLDYDDVLFRPNRSTLHSRKMVDLTRKFKILDHEFEIVPIIAANMDTVGTIEMSQELSQHNMLTALHKFYNHRKLIDIFKDSYYRDYCIYTLGSTDYDLDKFKMVNKKAKIKWVCIDVANGYSEKFIDFVAKFRDTYQDKILIAGNVSTADITAELVLKGVNIIKIGIGPGSSCTTRLMTGVGVPQLSAVIECADSAHGLGAHVIADGGCKTPGDIAKAFGGGADFVMLGGLLAGTDEGGGERVSLHGKQFVKFYGMSSEKANEKHFGGLKSYRAPEGKEVLVDYKGSVHDTIREITGGLRSTCTYIGARRLKDLPKCTTFVRCTKTHNTVFGGSNE